MPNAFLSGILLGLASLPLCSFCYILIVPPLLMEGRSGLRSSFRLLSFFAAGRLVGYVAIGAAAGAATPLLSFILKGHLLAVVYLTLALFLALWALRHIRKPHTECRASSRKPFLFGLLNGLCICPPFLVGMVLVMSYGSVASGVVLFVGFFIGATAPLILLAFSGMLGRLVSVHRIGLVVSLLLSFGLAGRGAALFAQNGVSTRTEKDRLEIFRELTPDAESFSGNLAGKDGPPYYAAYDSSGKVLAVLFFTDEVVPEVEGYAGRVPACVACDLKLTIKAVKFLPNNETPELVAEMFKEEFARQYSGKTYTDEFEAGKDVEGISGATYTTDAINRSIRLSLRRIASAYRPEVVEGYAASSWRFDGIRTALILLFFLLATFLFLVSAQKLRLVLLAASVAVLGYYYSAFMLTTDNIITLFTRGFPKNVESLVLIAGAVVTSFLFGRLYCGYICPFGAVSELLWRILPFKQRLSTNTAKTLRWVKYVLLLALIVLASLGSELYFAGSLEPFATTFLGVGRTLLLLVGIVLLLSAFFFRFYCRFLCPVGAVMELLAHVRIIRRKGVPVSCKLCTRCVEACPTEALTVEDGRIHYDPALCFNCTDCIIIRREKGCLERSDHPGMNTS